MSALYYLFLWTNAFLLGGLLIASFTRLITTKWLSHYRPFEKWLPWAWLAAALLFALNFSHFARVEGGSLRAHYFSTTGFLLRGISYFLLWVGLLLWQRRCARFGSVMIILLLVSGSLATFDWLMVLSKDFESTIFGILFLVSAILLNYGAFLYATRPRAALIDLNTVHLALIGTFTYFSVAQLLTIWSGNLPREVAYYLIRVHGGWRTFPEILAVAQFAIPLVFLLFRRFKKNPTFTRALGFWSVAMQSLYLYWALAPNFHPDEVFNAADFGVMALLLAGVAVLGVAHA